MPGTASRRRSQATPTRTGADAPVRDAPRDTRGAFCLPSMIRPATPEPRYRYSR
jgi:hypothetical protein